MPKRIRKASSTTERSRRMLGGAGGTKTVTKTKSIDSEGNKLKKRTVTKSSDYERKLNLRDRILQIDDNPRTQTKTSLKEKLANGSTRKIKTKTLERRPHLYSGPVGEKGRPSTTITKEKTKSPGVRTTRKTGSETIKNAMFINERPMPERTRSLSYKEGKKRTKFNK